MGFYSRGDRILFCLARRTGWSIDAIYRFWPPRYVMIASRKLGSIFAKLPSKKWSMVRPYRFAARCA